MVRVCDAIMGTGKSMAAIAYMNEHPDKKFIYIAPYLDEATRIMDGCPGLHFVEPQKTIPKYSYSKLLHTVALIQGGRNIATTHQAFKFYTRDMLEYIREHEYTLIIDESVDVLECFKLSLGDLELLIRAGHVEEDGKEYKLLNDDYTGTALSELIRRMKSQELIRADKGSNQRFYFWALPPDLINSFKDVYVLTYLFEGQGMYHFMKMYDIPYKNIGIERTADGGYRFSETSQYVPEYVSHIEDMIHILDNPKLNGIGDDYHALSMSWFSKSDSDIKQLKNNIYNCFINIWKDLPSEGRMWGSYDKASQKLQGRGYMNSHVVFNTKAKNEFRERDSLVYCANLFMNVGERIFYQSNGIDADEDMYALSIMVQWIWRSAIRDGKEISIYIPSGRMRWLLKEWMKSLSSTGGFTGFDSSYERSPNPLKRRASA